MGTRAGLWIGAELRRRWRALVVLSMVCGLVVTVVLTALAGARRTSTAYDRFLTRTSAPHADVQMIAGLRGRGDVDLGNGTTAEDLIASLRRLPEVEALTQGAALLLAPEGQDFYSAVSLDDRPVNQYRMVDGRMPEGLEEIALSRATAKMLGKGVGDELEVQGTDPRQAERLMIEGDTSVLQEPPAGPRFLLRVAGVVEGAGDIGRVDLSGSYGVVSKEFTRAALTGAVFATAAVTAVLVFGASLANVVAEPSLSGFPWDAAAGAGGTVEDAAGTVEQVVSDPDIDAVTVGYITDTTVEGERTQILATRGAKGRADLTMLAGRPPAAPDEVAVGPKTLERLPGRDANRVAVGTEDGGTRSFRIVGTAAFPILNYPDYDDGIWMAYEALPGLAVASGNAVVLITLADGVDVAGKRPGLEELGFDFANTGAPAGVANLDQVDRFPRALAAFLAALGLVIVGHALLSSPRRRRRELAVLRTLGLVRRQVAALFAVQATAVTAVGLLVGLPIGIAGGRTLWGLVATELSVVRQPIVPLSVLVVAPTALVVANLLAVLPARRAAGIRPAEIFRSE